jgi:hypothetical protein
MATNERVMTSASVKAIMQKRSTIPADAVGKRVKFLIQGNGNVIDVKDKEGELVVSTIPGYEGTVLQKKIFNLRANSGLAMQNARTRSYILDGLKAEKTGGKISVERNGVLVALTAGELLNDYLNSTQMSFGILLPNAIADKLASGVEIAAQVVKVDTDNGSLLTIDPSTISIVVPEVYGTTTFNLDDFIEKAEKTEEVTATV